MRALSPLSQLPPWYILSNLGWLLGRNNKQKFGKSSVSSWTAERREPTRVYFYSEGASVEFFPWKLSSSHGSENTGQVRGQVNSFVALVSVCLQSKGKDCFWWPHDLNKDKKWTFIRVKMKWIVTAALVSTALTCCCVLADFSDDFDTKPNIRINYLSLNSGKTNNQSTLAFICYLPKKSNTFPSSRASCALHNNTR